MKPLMPIFAALTAYLSCVLCAPGANYTNIIQFSSFSPATRTIKAGDTVVWINQDVVGHTVTGDTPQEEICGSQLLFQGGMCMQTFDTIGSFSYHCQPHPFMTGTIIVEPEAGTVTITAPANNASFIGPTNVLVRATATDANGTITNVSFFDRATPIGTDTSAPFEVNPTFGFAQHILTAVATDNTGARATSAPVTINITVAITSPANGSSFTGPTNVLVRSSSGVGASITSVSFFDGGTPIGSDTTAPFEVNPTFGLGQHVLTAIATDNTGAQATSAPVTITITSPRVTNPIADRIAKGNITIELQIVAEGMQSPLGFAVPDDSSGRIFVYDQAGLVWVLNNGVKVAAPALDIRNRLTLLGPYDERGLLGMATHPEFAQFPLVYTYTSEPSNGVANFTATGTNVNHQSVIAEWTIDAANPLRIDPASRREILRLDKPQSNHNGGTLRFGPDGLLYISVGDGGNADDEGDGHVAGGNAQSLENILGKVLRIDVNARTSANGQYGNPADNPFVGVAGIDEIYAYGLRNPFSFSFDRSGGTLYLGDVGQNAIEELDIITKGGNYGWRVKEGTFYFDPNGAGAGYVTTIPVVPEPPDLIDPIAQYDHDDGLAIIGGYVYRGSAVSSLAGKYVTGDWGNFSVPSGRLFYLDTGNVFKEFTIGRENRPLGEWLKGFGEGPDGELYVCVGKTLGPVGNSGRVLKVVPLPPEIQITGPQQSGTNLNVNWTGGTGPFVLEKKDALTDLSWNDMLTTANFSGSSPTEALHGFFRIGDLGKHAGIPLSVTLSGVYERPPIATAGSGFGTLRIEGNQLYLDLRYSGLSSTANAAHFHGPANASVSAGVLIDLGPLNGGAWGTSGTLSGALTLTPVQKALILDGKTYINIHTVNNPNGEIRGQVMPVLMQAFGNGANERPIPHVTPATFQSTMFLVGTQLTFNITYKNLTAPATVAHIHGPASSAVSGGVLIDLMPFHNGPAGREGSFNGTVLLSPNNYTSVVDRLTYVNIHSTTHPGGEIRGQIIPKASAIPLTASLNGASERPSPVTTPGTGFGSFRIDGHHLLFEVVYTNLNSEATAAHIHGPAGTTAEAGILIDLAPYVVGSLGRQGAFAGSILLTTAQKALMLGAQTYVNIHTANNPNGQIRGQIAPVLMWASLNGNNENPSVPTPALGQSTLLLVGNRLWFDVTYRNLVAASTASHIHAPASPFANAGVRVDFASFHGGPFGSTSGSLVGVVTLSSSGGTAANDLGNVIDGMSYINVHSTFRTGGEIRGQILR